MKFESFYQEKQQIQKLAELATDFPIEPYIDWFFSEGYLEEGWGTDALKAAGKYGAVGGMAGGLPGAAIGAAVGGLGNMAYNAWKKYTGSNPAGKLQTYVDNLRGLQNFINGLDNNDDLKKNYTKFLGNLTAHLDQRRQQMLVNPQQNQQQAPQQQPQTQQVPSHWQQNQSNQQSVPQGIS